MSMKKIKVEWLAAMLVVLVMGVVLVFLLISTLNPNSHEADITLPDSSDAGAEGDTQQRPREPGDTVRRVNVTKRNVQHVIETLDRPETYYIRVENVVSYQDESRVTSTEQWVLPDRCVTKTLDSLTNRALCTVTRDGGDASIWYEGDDRVLNAGAGSFQGKDVLAGMPTYEDILALDADVITVADYRDWDGYSCIYVEIYEQAMGYTSRYYIAVDTGLLVHAETYTQGELVYSMTMLEYSEDTSGSEGVVPPA